MASRAVLTGGEAIGGSSPPRLLVSQRSNSSAWCSHPHFCTRFHAVVSKWPYQRRRQRRFISATLTVISLPAWTAWKWGCRWGSL